MKLLQRIPLASVLFLLPAIASAADPPPQTSASNGAANPGASSTPNNSNGGNSAAPSISSKAASDGLIVITGAPAAPTSSVAVITGGPSATTGGGLTGLPKLPGQYTIAPASVPPTANAPYMQVSKLPEGSVFILVGGVLGLMAFIVLTWRAVSAWSLRRAVKRAAMHRNMIDAKSIFAPPLYTYSDRESSTTLVASKANKKSRPPPPLPNIVPSQSLFFSPTAGVAAAGMLNPGNRGSNYLPSGYYAAGAAAPGDGHGLAHIGTRPQARESISMSNLGPGPGRRNSPPESMDIQRGDYVPGHRPRQSSSSNMAPRAPSAYLDDLFDDSGKTLAQIGAQGGR